MGVKVAAPRVVTSPDMKNATVGVIRGVGAALTMVCFAVPAAAESVKRYTIEQFMKTTSSLTAFRSRMTKRRILFSSNESGIFNVSNSVSVTGGKRFR